MNNYQPQPLQSPGETEKASGSCRYVILNNFNFFVVHHPLKRVNPSSSLTQSKALYLEISHQVRMKATTNLLTRRHRDKRKQPCRAGVNNWINHSQAGLKHQGSLTSTKTPRCQEALCLVHILTTLAQLTCL
ncbi:hypothetical protein FGO68_gene12993 [Halteria grandinella]|uniref:Uncharacterized protein n=1 Tax=Halteria grandinella TaxID=5974 RepID=A0A8J8T2V5_HALGN|nr:hypothetical protein FGO68_gene12993 [Halteria grandinella]